jgi:hypothetical protein
MKLATIALTIVLLPFAVAPTAHAADRVIPIQFQGSWCDPSNEAWMTSIPLRRCANDESPNFRIRANGYLGPGSNWSCKFTSIKFNSLRNAVNADALCQHRSGTWSERAIFVLDQDALKFLAVELRNDSITTKPVPQ